MFSVNKNFIGRGVGAWRALNRYTHQSAPRNIRGWLFDQGSLTAKLQQRASGELSVRVLRQRSACATLSECRSLGLKMRSQCVIREVVLEGPGNVPWVFARSIFPMRSLTGPLQHLKKFGTRPLGGYLFSQPKLKRGPIQIAALKQAENNIPSELQQGCLLWGRRSVFSLFGRELLVSEVFLPGLVNTGN